MQHKSCVVVSTNRITDEYIVAGTGNYCYVNNPFRFSINPDIILFIGVHVQSLESERSCTCVLEVSRLLIFRFLYWTLVLYWYCCIFSFSSNFNIEIKIDLRWWSISWTCTTSHRIWTSTFPINAHNVFSLLHISYISLVLWIVWSFIHIWMWNASCDKLICLIPF
jgi:hypothetical protein